MGSVSGLIALAVAIVGVWRMFASIRRIEAKSKADELTAKAERAEANRKIEAREKEAHAKMEAREKEAELNTRVFIQEITSGLMKQIRDMQTEQNDMRTEIEHERRKAEGKITGLETDLATALTERGEMETRVKTLEAEIVDLKAQISEILQQAQEEKRKVETERDAALAKLAELQVKYDALEAKQVKERPAP